MSGMRHRKSDYRLVSIAVSLGELVDRITILQLKSKRVQDKVKRGEATRQLLQLERALIDCGEMPDCFWQLVDELQFINSELWNLENHIRDLEQQNSFGSDFIETARAIYRNNGRRHIVKDKINDCTNSIEDIKEYTPFS